MAYDCANRASSASRYTNPQSYNHSCSDEEDSMLIGVTIVEVAKINCCKYHKPQRGAPSLKRAYSDRAPRCGREHPMIVAVATVKGGLAKSAPSNKALHRIRLPRLPWRTDVNPGGPMSFIRSAEIV